MSEFIYRIPDVGDFKSYNFEGRLPVRGDMARLGIDLFEVVNVIFHAGKGGLAIVELSQLDCPTPPREYGVKDAP